MKNLHGRIEQLERAAGGDFDARLRLLLARLHAAQIDGAERLIEEVRHGEGRFSREIGDDGTITLEGLRRLCHLGASGQSKSY
jgi:hypothetical protein